MTMPGRKYSSDKYRYGFNGQEKSDELDPNGSSLTAEFWQYDVRIGRRWNVDPVIRAYESPFATFGNNPILLNDPDGPNPVDPQKHTVQKGDNLSKLSKKYNVSISNLSKWNKIADRNKISIEQSLIVSSPENAVAQTIIKDYHSFLSYPDFGQSTGWTLRNANQKNEFELTTATSGVGVGKASLGNFDLVYLQGGLLEQIRSDPDLVFNENVLVGERLCCIAPVND